jgi:hypothetical protein
MFIYVIGHNMNTDLNKQLKCNDFFTDMNQKDISYLRNNYKIVDVDYLDPFLVRYKMFDDNFFTLPTKKDIMNNMLDYYFNHKDREIYKKTDYLCNTKEKVCICNTHAEDFRKIYDGVNYKPNEKYISWFKKD